MTLDIVKRAGSLPQPISTYAVVAPRSERRAADAAAASELAFPDLTPIERRVAACLVRDLERGQISHELRISNNWASKAIRRIYAKLGVSGRAGLTRYSIRRGYVQP